MSTRARHDLLDAVWPSSSSTPSPWSWPSSEAGGSSPTTPQSHSPVLGTLPSIHHLEEEEEEEEEEEKSFAFGVKWKVKAKRTQVALSHPQNGAL